MNVSLNLKLLLLMLLFTLGFLAQTMWLKTYAISFIEKWSANTGLVDSYLEWMPNGTYLVVWNSNKVLVYSRGGSLSYSLEYKGTPITSVDTCYDNRHIVLTTFNTSAIFIDLILYDLSSSRTDSYLMFVGASSGGVSCSKIFPRVFIVTRRAKNTVSFNVYNIVDGDLRLDYSLEDNGSSVKLFSWSSDGVEASYVIDDALRIVSGVAPYKIRKIYAPANTSIIDYAWSPDSMYLAVVLSNHKLAVYDIVGEQLWSTRIDSVPTSIEWAKNIIIVSDASGNILLYKWLGPNTRLVYQYNTGIPSINDIALDNDKSLLAVLSYSGVLKVYDVYGVLEYYSAPLITITSNSTITSTVLSYTTSTITKTYTKYITTTYYTRTTISPAYATFTTRVTLTTEHTLTSTHYVVSTLTRTATTMETIIATTTRTLTSTATLTDTDTTTLTETLTDTKVSYPYPRPTQSLVNVEDLVLGLLLVFATSMLSFLIIRRASSMR